MKLPFRFLLSRPRIAGTLFVLVALLGASRAQAQSSIEPAQLPARTLFYVAWHGTPTGDVRKSNALLALWDDPDIAPMRAALMQNAQGQNKKDSGKPAMTAQEIEEASTLLENSFVLGYLRKPEAQTGKATERPWNGIFFLYDRTGKEALVAKTILRFRSQAKEVPQVSQITIAGAPALKIASKDSVTYWADHGKYAVSAGELGVLEELLARIDGKGAASSLGQVAAYQEAKPLLNGGVLEFFLRVPQLKEFAPETAAPNMPIKIAPVLDALRLDAVHSVAGRLTLEGVKSRVQHRSDLNGHVRRSGFRRKLL